MDLFECLTQITLYTLLRLPCIRDGFAFILPKNPSEPEFEQLHELILNWPPASFDEERQRYSHEQADIARVDHDKERERDGKSAEADHLMHQHHRFANSVALFQVASSQSGELGPGAHRSASSRGSRRRLGRGPTRAT